MSEDEKKAKRSKKATTNGTVGLFDPMTLRGMTVRNRIWLPPMDTYSALAQDGLPTPFHYQHYVSRAMGGFGMVIVEATAVTPEGRISQCDLGLWADEQIDGSSMPSRRAMSGRRSAMMGPSFTRSAIVRVL